MLDITLLNNSDWCLSIGAGGFGRVKVINGDGKHIFATREEKNFLQDLIRCIVTINIPDSTKADLRDRIFRDFCDGLFQRYVDGNSKLYHLFIGNGPEETVYYYTRRDGYKSLAGQ
jgi:hypothetical protein